MQQSQVSQGFGAVWKDLFSSPVHLDSLLSRQTPKMKSLLAKVLPLILLRPVSLAEDLGIGVTPGEPWSLNPERLKSWNTALEMALAIHERLEGGQIPEARGLPEDFPPELAAEMDADWGVEVATRLRSALVKRAPMTLRLSRRVSPEALIEGWRKSGKFPVRITPTAAAPLGVEFADYSPVFHLPEYERGEFEIQDEGSQVMALYALDPEAGAAALTPVPGASSSSAQLRLPDARWGSLRVVDACAGAGGKSLAMADLMMGQGRLFSYDISERKIQSLRRRATHARLNNIQAMALPEGRETEALAKFEGTADRVLVDAPCSGWGVLRRNPDIKWRQEKDALSRFPAIQLRLLEAYSRLVKSGGILTYGTCTFRKGETTDVVERFEAGQGGRFERLKGGFFGPGASDGFFMQAWKRVDTAE